MSAKFNLDTMYCGHVKRGDIFLVEDETGERVAVAVQDDILNERLGTVLAVPIEPVKAGETVYRNELLLKPAETNFGRAGLCLTHKICAVDRRQLVAKKGELHPDRLRELLAALDVTLGRFRDK